MNVVSHHSEQHLQRLADRQPRADRAKRLRTVLMARQGFTAPEVAICTGFSPRSVQEWVARYNREGLSGLETKAGHGRSPPLTPEEAGTIETTPRRRPVAGRWRMHGARQRRKADFAARIRQTPVAQRGLWPAASVWLFVVRPATATSPGRSRGAGWA